MTLREILGAQRVQPRQLQEFRSLFEDPRRSGSGGASWPQELNDLLERFLLPQGHDASDALKNLLAVEAVTRRRSFLLGQQPKHRVIVKGLPRKAGVLHDLADLV